MVLVADDATAKPHHEQNKQTGGWTITVPPKMKDFDIVTVSGCMESAGL